MMHNYDKLNFGATINNNPSYSDCMNYGMISGCDSGCPVLLSGKCREPSEVLKVIDDFDLIEELKKLYSINQ